MKAIVIHEYGPPDVLRYQDWPDPEPRAGEIRIKVHAATVNRVLDVSLRAGKEMARGAALPLIPGVDCAGIVDAVGPHVTRWKVGDRVAAAGFMPLELCAEDGKDYIGPTGMMGIKRPGGFAERVTVPACAGVAIPSVSIFIVLLWRCVTCRRRGTCWCMSRRSKPARPCWSWAPAAISARSASR
jgi:NADPH:quinone reductase-like Zn-dependent oxidoreductase